MMENKWLVEYHMRMIVCKADLP